MDETIIEQIARVLEVEVDELPTYVVYDAYRAYIAEHWDTTMRPALLRLLEELNNELIIKERLRDWVGGTESGKGA